MAAKSDVPAKVRWCNRHKYGQTKHFWAKSSQEDFAQRFFVWPYLCPLHHLNFAGTSLFAAISRLRAGITRTKMSVRPLYYTYTELWVRNDSVGTPPQKNFTLKIFGYGPISKKKQIFVNFCVRLVKTSVGPLWPQFWCHRGSTYLVLFLLSQGRSSTAVQLHESSCPWGILVKLSDLDFISIVKLSYL